MEIFKKCTDKEEDKSYDHQLEIAKILDKMDEEDNFSTLVSVPTGGGKTRIAIEFCRNALRDKEKNNKVLWLADSIDLLIQSIERFNAMNIPRDITYQMVCTTSVSKSLERKGGKDKINVGLAGIEQEADMLFASIQTILGFQDSNNQNQKFTEWLSKLQGKLYIIYDEAHHIGAKGTEGFFKKLIGNGEKDSPIISCDKFALIGLTATVYRYDSPVESFNRWFKNGWSKSVGITTADTPYGEGTKDFVNNRIEIVSVKDLIDKKILVKPTIIRVDDFEMKGRQCDKINSLAEKIKRHRDKWGKTIVFVDNTANAGRLCELLGEDISFVYTSEGKYSQSDLDNFKKVGSKNHKIMIAVDMVSEGFDVKDVQTIYLFSKIYSHVLLRQRIGRVLRKADKVHKQEATVYWQKYFADEDIGATKPDDAEEIVETDKDIEEDIRSWKKGMQLPAGMYLEDLPTDPESERIFNTRYEFLHVLDLFGAEQLNAGIGYFKLDDERKICAGKAEKAGYEHFYHVIRSDFFSKLVFCEEYKSFKNYADELGVKVDELIENIKITSFYLSNAKKTDTKGKITKKKRLTVLPEDIQSFYEWVVENDLKMPEYLEYSATSAEQQQHDGTGQPNNLEGKDVDELPEEKLLYEAEQIKDYMKEKGIQKVSSLCEAMKLHQSIKAELEKKRRCVPKVYPDILTYGEHNDKIHQQLLSARALMEVGAIYERREKGKSKQDETVCEMALYGKDKEGKYSVNNVIARSINQVGDDDLLFLATALVEIPNHICVRKEDIGEYKDLLIKGLPKVFNNTNMGDKEKLTREFIMALGYKGSDNIIRMQCEIFFEKLPRILQYVIYGKVYLKLIEEIKDCKDDILAFECPKELDNIFSDTLKDYGVKKLDADLNPVKDFIADYRPYLKVVPYYQGIKPEFLCRMLNDMLWLGDKTETAFVDAFGGSGTISMNMDADLKLKQSYNDKGLLNKALFDTIEKDGGKALKSLIGEFVNLIINHTGDERRAEKFLKPYEKVLNKVADRKYDLDASLNAIEQHYQKCYQEKVKNHNKNAKEDKKWEKLDARLKKREESYYEIMQCVLENPMSKEDSVSQYRKIEEFLHPMMLKIGAIFNRLKEEKDGTCELDNAHLAFIFFMYHSLTARYFYNDAIIDSLAKFVGTYEKNIDNCYSAFHSIEISGKDALDLIEEGKEKNAVWYCDIPYTGTNVSSYCADGFNEVDFVNKLSNCAGDYIVASRFNICEKGEKNLKKRKSIIRFYNRFVPKDQSDRYLDLIEKKYPKDDTKDKNADWNNIKESKKAKYVVFAFSQIGKDDDGYIENSKQVSIDSIRRMLKNTQISDIPVEVMITNMELDLSKMPVQQMSGKDVGIAYMPTFKTRSSYMVEPVTIIMEYEKFMFSMMLYLVADKLNEEVETRELAAAFRRVFQN